MYLPGIHHGNCATIAIDSDPIYTDWRLTDRPRKACFCGARISRRALTALAAVPRHFGRIDTKQTDAFAAASDGVTIARGAVGDSSENERRSEEHTSELQSLMRISYAVFCLKKKKKQHDITIRNIQLKNRKSQKDIDKTYKTQ